MTETEKRLYSIGHSNHAPEHFVDLLRKHAIQVLVDIRSQPYSQYAPQFNRENLKQLATGAGVTYLFMGEELGGRPKGAEFYDQDGHVLYAQVARAPFFLEGIRRLEIGIQEYRVAIMCSEENPLDCHRYLLVGRVLNKRGIRVGHIRGDGRLQEDAELRVADHDARQAMLFQEVEEAAWRSTRSVSPRSRQPTSSGSVLTPSDLQR